MHTQNKYSMILFIQDSKTRETHLQGQKSEQWLALRGSYQPGESDREPTGVLEMFSILVLHGSCLDT